MPIPCSVAPSRRASAASIVALLYSLLTAPVSAQPAGGDTAEPSVTGGAAEPAAESGAPAPVADVPPVQLASEPAAEAEVPAYTLTGAQGSGVTLTVGDVFSLNVRSRIQLRYQLSIPNEDAMGDRDLDQLVNIGTARLWFSGHIRVPELTYMIQLAVAGRDFRDGAISPIFDAYLDWKVHRDFSLRAGQFFVPFDRLRTVRESGLQMADRPRPVLELTLDRDVGVMLYSDHFLGDESPVAWRVGVFGGGGTNLSLGREPGALLVARVELRPLGDIDDDTEGDLKRRAQPGLALGAAFAANLNTNRSRSTTGTTFTGGTTDYVQAALDLVFKWRGCALQAEYIYRGASNDQILSTDDDGNPVVEYTRSGHGWILQGSYVFDPPFELVGRVSRLYALSGTAPAYISEVDTRGLEIAAGANYYFNDHKLKLQADWIARMPPGAEFGRADHVVHLQLDITL
jgi:hypothetical protein